MEAKREQKYEDKKRENRITGAGGWKRGSHGGVGESHDRHLCSPRLHLTLYEPMKWLNHFTTDVYNAIDPYLFITPVYRRFPRLSFRPSRLASSLSSRRKVTFLLLLRLISRENKFNMCRGTRRFVLLREYRKFHLRSRSTNCTPDGLSRRANERNY